MQVGYKRARYTSYSCRLPHPFSDIDFVCVIVLMRGTKAGRSKQMHCRPTPTHPHSSLRLWWQFWLLGKAIGSPAQCGLAKHGGVTAVC